MISKAQKQAIDYAISLNGTPVTLHRVGYEPHEGARRKVEKDIAEQTWLVFPRGLKPKKKREDGGRVDESDWQALAPSTADVQWGSDVTDSFTLEGIGTFEVTGGKVLTIGPDVNGYQLDLKLVK